MTVLHSAVSMARRLADGAQGGPILASDVVRAVGGSLAGMESRHGSRRQHKGIGRQRVHGVVRE